MKQRDDALDLVRLVAAVMIVVFHFNSMFAPKGDVSAGPLRYANGSFGNFGVALFFLLSGYALMLRYGEACPLKAFTNGGFFSIYPLYWLCFFSLFFYSDILHGNLPPGVPGWSIIWSVLALDGYLAGVVPTFYLLGEWFVGCIVLFVSGVPAAARGAAARGALSVCAVLAVGPCGWRFIRGPLRASTILSPASPFSWRAWCWRTQGQYRLDMARAALRRAKCFVRPLWAAGFVAAAVLFWPPAPAAGGVRPFAGRSCVSFAARPGPRAAEGGVPCYPASGRCGVCGVPHPPCAFVYRIPAACGAAAYEAAGLFAVRCVFGGDICRGHPAERCVGPCAGPLAGAAGGLTLDKRAKITYHFDSVFRFGKCSAEEGAAKATASEPGRVRARRVCAARCRFQGRRGKASSPPGAWPRYQGKEAAVRGNLGGTAVFEVQGRPMGKYMGRLFCFFEGDGEWQENVITGWIL